MLKGVNVTIFIDCIRVLRKKKIRSASAIYLFTTAAMLFVFVTMVGGIGCSFSSQISLSRSLQHLVVDINRNMNAFTTHSSIKNYSDQYYATFAAFQDVFKSAIYTAATICADAFIVRIPYYHRGNLFQKVSLLVQLYRCFIVWSRSYLVIIIPSLLFLADIGTQIILRPLT